MKDIRERWNGGRVLCIISTPIRMGRWEGMGKAEGFRERTMLEWMTRVEDMLCVEGVREGLVASDERIVKKL